MKKKTIILSALALTYNVHAANVDGGAVLGSMVGAGVGSAVGSSIGGKEGAIIGGGAGGAIGAAVGSHPSSTQTTTRTVNRDRVIYVDDRHDNGKHKGQYKEKHRHGHDD